MRGSRPYHRVSLSVGRSIFRTHAWGFMGKRKLVCPRPWLPWVPSAATWTHFLKFFADRKSPLKVRVWTQGLRMLYCLVITEGKLQVQRGHASSEISTCRWANTESTVRWVPEYTAQGFGMRGSGGEIQRTTGLLCVWTSWLLLSRGWSWVQRRISMTQILGMNPRRSLWGFRSSCWCLLREAQGRALWPSISLLHTAPWALLQHCVGDPRMPWWLLLWIYKPRTSKCIFSFTLWLS